MTHFPSLNIVITGPESTGKSHLAKALAVHYQTSHLPEYARFYLNQLKRPYTEQDILIIAKEQFQQQKKLQKSNPLLFSDTGLVVLNIWSTYKYGRCHSWITNKLAKQSQHFYLLCQPDIPWIDDPLRENPQDRTALFSLFKNTLAAYQLPFAEIHGEGDTRIQNAITIINKLFMTKPSSSSTF